MRTSVCHLSSRPIYKQRLARVTIPLLILAALLALMLVAVSPVRVEASASPVTPGNPWAWGHDLYSALGTGTCCNSSSTPVRVTHPIQDSRLIYATAIAAGDYHNLAITPSGTVYSWGDGANGQLGDDSLSPISSPLQVMTLANVVAVAAGGQHSLAVESDGSVWAWGSNDAGQTGPYTEQLCSDAYFNNFRCNLIPTQIRDLSGITAVAAGSLYSLALKSDGAVWAWGDNSYGELGNGGTTSNSTPMQISGLTSVVAIAAGGGHSLALRSDGTVWAWGQNYAGQLGAATTGYCTGTPCGTIPVQVNGLNSVVAIAASGGHSLALRSDGTVWAWGDNSVGQLGNSSAGSGTTSPVQVSGLTGVTSIAAGLSHSLALRSDGTAWAWGSNWVGQLGNGTTTNSPVPVQVSNLTGVTAIAAGGNHNLVLVGPFVTLSPANLSFGSQLVGSSTVAQTVTITNSGMMPLHVNAATLTGTNSGDFATTADTCSSTTVAPGVSCTIGITFTPTASGSRTASLSIPDDATGSPQTVVLSGDGISIGGTTGDGSGGGTGTATPELGSVDLLAIGMVPVAVLLYRRRCRLTAGRDKSSV